MTMSDATLLALGCALIFLAASGAYVYLRGDFSPAERESAELEPQPVRIVRR
jgi:hypothetical protein